MGNLGKIIRAIDVPTPDRILEPLYVDAALSDTTASGDPSESGDTRVESADAETDRAVPAS